MNANYARKQKNNTRSCKRPEKQGAISNLIWGGDQGGWWWRVDRLHETSLPVGLRVVEACISASQGASVTYPGTLSLSRAHLTHLADLIRGHRVRIGSRWRGLTPGRQALLVLAHLRNGDTYTRLAAGFEVGLATVYRYVREATDLLAARAPSLTAALWRLAGNGHRLGVLDGTVVRIDRLRGDLDRLYYSGKHHHHGVNLQGLVDPRRGGLVWISGGLPGSTRDLTAARTHDVITTARWADVELLADKGYQGPQLPETRRHPRQGRPHPRTRTRLMRLKKTQET
ncbi:transposase family protein [Phytohabitans sp. ZYX-F-186]|uniref:Transposase family protein n=1 Tax=Phytohabitans maris TaxID=3071409 RepID=A0ABU0ZTD2_9ACTN|nr:transposase family protein [Phytohabitans sp. ZYX-F-186]MDQ7909470.1 transposase family protein [Phytohabitans sp. ZYX-F-186]